MSEWHTLHHDPGWRLGCRRRARRGYAGGQIRPEKQLIRLPSISGMHDLLARPPRQDQGNAEEAQGHVGFTAATTTGSLACPWRAGPSAAGSTLSPVSDGERLAAAALHSSAAAATLLGQHASIRVSDWPGASPLFRRNTDFSNALAQQAQHSHSCILGNAAEE